MRDAVARCEIAFDIDAVPAFRMSDIGDDGVVVLAPEERHGIESFPSPENIACCNLALAFRHDPVLHTDRCALSPWRKAGHVAGGVDTRHAGLQKLIYHYATID